MITEGDIYEVKDTENDGCEMEVPEGDDYEDEDTL